MPSHLRRIAALALIPVLLAACGDSSPTVGAPSDAAPVHETTATGAAASGAANTEAPAEDRSLIRTIDTDGFAAMLESARGDVVLLNLWATWCAPCLKEIPDLVELERDLAERGLSVVGISLDDADAGEEVQSFRDEYFPEFFTYHVLDDDWYALLADFAPNWPSVLPTVFVIDRNGELVQTLVGGKDYEEFAAIVEPLL